MKQMSVSVFWVRDAEVPKSFPSQHVYEEQNALQLGKETSQRFRGAYVAVIIGSTDDPYGPRLATYLNGELL